MRRLLLTLCLVLSFLGAEASPYRIFDIDVSVALRRDGSASFTEVWHVEAGAGTEWYLVKENLGDIRISGFGVSEDGVEFVNEGDWDIDRSIDRKAGRCGTVRRQSGYELCWGIGRHGEHTFTVHYDMSNVVKSLHDYDMFHMQLVSPGLSAEPEHVTARITGPEPVSGDNARIWGFGYNGSVAFSSDGSVVYESDGRFEPNSSLISLIRFDKGIFESGSIQDRDFADALNIAMEGASFDDDEQDDDFLAGLLAMLMAVLAVFGIAGTATAVNRRNVLGCREKDIDWCRDIPFKGDILQAGYALERLGENRRNTIASAMILRMIGNGQILISKDGKDRVELSFNENADLTTMGKGERGLYDMMKMASGDDLILQRNEFSRWARRHTATVSRWAERTTEEGKERAAAEGNIEGRKFTEKGKAESRKVIGFRKYLKDFTLLDERGSQEVGLWHEYLVFAALFGIADTVAKELKEINPQAFEQILGNDYNTTWTVINMSRSMADSITNARAAQASKSASRRGFGGSSSFGGGGGFSGGGFGGGGR